MSLPSPLPDDPTKWDGWKRFQSADFYERLCLSFESRPTAEQIEEHTRLLLIWWQKKLPLKNQPSNPIAQMLRGGIDAAPRHLVEARTELLNPVRRAAIDQALGERFRQGAMSEFQKFLDFALAEKVLSKDAEANLYKLARALGLRGEDVTVSIHHGLISAGAVREADLPRSSPKRTAVIAPLLGARALPRRTRVVTPFEQFTPEEERQRFPAFRNSLDGEMLLVTTGRFLMGSRTPEAPINEQPATQVTLRRFYLARHPVTNAQYEEFDPAHAKWRLPRADETHPVVYVTHADAVKFCLLLSERDNRQYRLPTEAEWEYAARGSDGRIFPWAAAQKISLTKFTLTRGTNGHSNGECRVAGAEERRAPGAAAGQPETSPVGTHPLEASPFGVEDLLGNVWEWCEDYYDKYQGAERLNPRGAAQGTQRVCRGGSWKSRPGSLQATTRGYNVPTYASNDVGFRVACDCL